MVCKRQLQTALTWMRQAHGRWPKIVCISLSSSCISGKFQNSYFWTYGCRWITSEICSIGSKSMALGDQCVNWNPVLCSSISSNIIWAIWRAFAVLQEGSISIAEGRCRVMVEMIRSDIEIVLAVNGLFYNNHKSQGHTWERFPHFIPTIYLCMPCCLRRNNSSFRIEDGIPKHGNQRSTSRWPCLGVNHVLSEEANLSLCSIVYLRWP